MSCFATEIGSSTSSERRLVPRQAQNGDWFLQNGKRKKEKVKRESRKITDMRPET